MNTAQNQLKKSSQKINPFVNLFWLSLGILPLFAFMWVAHFGVPWGAVGLSQADIYNALQQHYPMPDQAVTNHIVKQIKFALDLGFVSGFLFFGIFSAIFFFTYSFAPFFQEPDNQG
ncbi:MAG: hypothetical protein AB7U29_04790 [Desulfobulbus sp.]